MVSPGAAELRARHIQPTQPFRERFDELDALGYRDHEMPARLGLTPDSLVRMMQREGLKPSRLLAEMSHDRKAGR